MCNLEITEIAVIHTVEVILRTRKPSRILRTPFCFIATNNGSNE